MVEVINKLGRIQRELLQALGREPTREELAKEMDITPGKVLEIPQYAREPILPDQTIGDEGDSQLGDFIGLQLILQQRERHRVDGQAARSGKYFRPNGRIPGYGHPRRGQRP